MDDGITSAATVERTRQRWLLAAWALYVVVSAAFALKAIPLMPDVGLLDTAYFAVVTVSTVGYGDIAPQTPRAKQFVMLYTFVGVVLLSVTVAFRDAKRMRRLEGVARAAQGARWHAMAGNYGDGRASGDGQPHEGQRPAIPC